MPSEASDGRLSSVHEESRGQDIEAVIMESWHGEPCGEFQPTVSYGKRNAMPTTMVRDQGVLASVADDEQARLSSLIPSPLSQAEQITFRNLAASCLLLE